MSDRREPGEGMLPDSADFVRPPGGPSLTQGGVMPGGPEMESWKRPLKDEANLDTEETVEEQAENLRRRVEDS